MAVSVRTARASDAGDVAHLTAQLGYDVETSVLRARLSRILERPDQRFLIAERDARPVGWLHAAMWEYVEADAFVLIGGLVVDRAHRRQGIGRVLMEDAERWALQHGCSVVRLWSSAGRIHAHQFYERLGYTKIKTQYSFAKLLTPGGREGLKGFVPRIED